MLKAIKTVLYKNDEYSNWYSGLHIFNDEGDWIVLDLDTLEIVEVVRGIVDTGKVKINF